MLNYTVNKGSDFPNPAGMSLTKFSLVGNNFNYARLVTSRAGDGKNSLTFFYSVLYIPECQWIFLRLQFDSQLTVLETLNLIITWMCGQVSENSCCENS
jgi:hypothetical protein